jgi:hypothetical protein
LLWVLDLKALWLDLRLYDLIFFRRRQNRLTPHHQLLRGVRRRLLRPLLHFIHLLLRLPPARIPPTILQPLALLRLLRPPIIIPLLPALPHLLLSAIHNLLQHQQAPLLIVEVLEQLHLGLDELQPGRGEVRRAKLEDFPEVPEEGF